ncbi:MAG TPA: ATP-binding protein [Candidatus Binatia bacterium]|nr:ATP-binding protein [Candidatus Binatia bacterium]
MLRARKSPARLAAALLLAAVGVLAVVVACAGLQWVGRPFPGFLLLRNRVVASVSLPGWPVAIAPDLFQATIVAVDEAPVASAQDVYAAVRARPVGTRFAYTVERDGERTLEWVDSRLFGWSDAVLIFGAYLLDGLVFAGIGVWVWMLSPRRVSTWALLGLGLASSTYALTAIDLYDPHRFFRLHALAECFLPATLFHLALVFPVRRASALRAALACYLPAACLAFVYQQRLDAPTLYPGVHSLATVGIVAAGLTLIGTLVWGYLRPPSQLVRQRVRFVTLGGVVSFALPAAIFTVSVLEGGRVPVNTTAFTVFLFPLSIAYAVHKRDLFEIDALVQRAFYYAILSGVVTAAYLTLAALATHGLHLSRFGQSPAFSLGFTLTMLIVLPRVRDRVQQLVDLVFGRRSYDAQETLATASTALGATLSLDDILRLMRTIPAATLGLDRVAVFLRHDGVFEEAAPAPTASAMPARRLAEDRPLIRVLTGLPRPLVRESLRPHGEPEHAAAMADFEALGGDLVVPLVCQGTLSGLLVCGRSQSGVFFSAGDVSFLHTFANQAALSLQNARTYHDLELLNRDLEERVNARTRELAESRDQLSDSLDQLGTAYRGLQASQEQLIAAQKMAAFGRLAAGIAHEMNTPLGAALNGLKIAGELVGECRAMTVDPETPAADREAAFGELAGMVRNVEEWTHKAAAYIKSVKAQGRTAAGRAGFFDLGRLLERDLQPLLLHRLRLVGGTLDVRLPPDLPELYGDSARLGQVLANIINNAIDACEGLPPERARIVITAERDGDEIVVHARDRGTGIPADARERIFEAFYTTKPPGKGTGLGLSIARDILTGEFGGSLVCSASDTGGTTFTIRLPLPSRDGTRQASGVAA